MVKENVTANFPSSNVADKELGVLTNIEGETLTGDVTSTQATFDVSDASVYEAGMYVAVWTGGTLSIYRVNSVDAAADQITLDTDGTGNRKAFDGTTANSHNEADEVACYAVAKTFNQSRAEVVAMQDWLGTDGDTVTWDRALELHYTGTAGTPTLRVGTVSGQGDPEPLIEFERSTDGGTSWSSVGAIDYDPANDQLELSNIEFVAAASSNINLEDGQELRLGTDYDLRARWDQTNTRTELATDNPVRLQRQATVTDASALDSPTVEWEGQYDSDAAGSSLTASTRVIGAQNVVEYASAGGDYRLAFTDDTGTEFVTLEGDTQNVGIQATDPTTILALVENDTGLAHASVDTVGLQTAGVEALRVQSDQDIALQAGTTLWLSANNDTGLLRRAADEVGIAQSDDVSVLGPDATSTTTTQNSPDLILTGQHWTGTATSQDDAVIRHNITGTTPSSQLEFSLLGTVRATLGDGGLWQVDGALNVDGTGDSYVAGSTHIGGTSSPSVALEVTGAIEASTTITSGGPVTIDDDSNGTIELGDSTTSGAGATSPFIDFSFGVGASQDFNFRVQNSADERLRFQDATGRLPLTLDNGRVGIREQTPEAPLDIHNNAASATHIHLTNLNATDGDNTDVLARFQDSAGNEFTGVRTRYQVDDVTDATEDASWLLSVQSAGTLTDRMEADGTGLGFFGVAPVAQQTAPVSLTNNMTNTTTDDALESVPDTTGMSDASPAIERNLTELKDEIDQIRTVLTNLGLAS